MEQRILADEEANTRNLFAGFAKAGIATIFIEYELRQSNDEGHVNWIVKGIADRNGTKVLREDFDKSPILMATVEIEKLTGDWLNFKLEKVQEPLSKILISLQNLLNEEVITQDFASHHGRYSSERDWDEDEERSIDLHNGFASFDAVSKEVIPVDENMEPLRLVSLFPRFGRFR